jgi:hypothetical protein
MRGFAIWRFKVLQRYLVCGIVSVALLAGRAGADERLHQIKILGSGTEVELDPQSIPVEMQQGYLAMKLHCLSCHGQERMITTLRTGISPVTKHAYGEVEFHDKIIKVMRSSRADLDRSHAKTLTDFFHFLIKKAHLS